MRHPCAIGLSLRPPGGRRFAQGRRPGCKVPCSSICSLLQVLIANRERRPHRPSDHTGSPRTTVRAAQPVPSTVESIVVAITLSPGDELSRIQVGLPVWPVSPGITMRHLPQAMVNNRSYLVRRREPAGSRGCRSDRHSHHPFPSLERWPRRSPRPKSAPGHFRAPDQMWCSFPPPRAARPPAAATARSLHRTEDPAAPDSPSHSPSVLVRTSNQSLEPLIPPPASPSADGFSQPFRDASTTALSIPRANSIEFIAAGTARAIVHDRLRSPSPAPVSSPRVPSPANGLGTAAPVTAGSSGSRDRSVICSWIFQPSGAWRSVQTLRGTRYLIDQRLLARLILECEG